jgi:hypothetical protein
MLDVEGIRERYKAKIEAVPHSEAEVAKDIGLTRESLRRWRIGKLRLSQDAERAIGHRFGFKKKTIWEQYQSWYEDRCRWRDTQVAAATGISQATLCRFRGGGGMTVGNLNTLSQFLETHS